MKKKYITPECETTLLQLEGTIAVSQFEEEGDGWHSQKKEQNGWSSDIWSNYGMDKEN